MKRQYPKTLKEAIALIKLLESNLKNLASRTTFSCNDSEAKKIHNFCKKHMGCERGAIGGAHTVSFGITSLGCAIKVKCHCGAEKDCTDYSSW